MSVRYLMSTCWGGSQSPGRWRKVGLCCFLDECDHPTCWVIFFHFFFFEGFVLLEGFVIVLPVFSPWDLELLTISMSRVNSYTSFSLWGRVLANVLPWTLTIMVFMRLNEASNHRWLSLQVWGCIWQVYLMQCTKQHISEEKVHLGPTVLTTG